MLVISACLTGVACRYDGKDQLRVDLKKLVDDGEAIAVCPEELGGLPTPRTPAEKQGLFYKTKTGQDVTQEYKLGAKKAYDLAKSLGEINKAILKSKSPMCGVDQIYDGSFSGKLRHGDGEFSRLLKEKGIEVEARN